MTHYIMRVVPGGQPAAGVDYDDEGLDMDAPADLVLLVMDDSELELGRETYKNGHDACAALAAKVQRI